MTPVEWTDAALYRLLDAARQAGLPIGVAEHLKVFEIAAYVRQQGLAADPVRLRQHLSPIVVRSTEQVEVFERCFNDWWMTLGGAPEAVGAPEPPPPLEDSALAVVDEEAPRGRYLAVGGAIALVLLVGIAWFWPEPLPEPTFQDEIASPDSTQQPDPTQPTDPTQPSDPIQPTDPTKPTQPATPAAPAPRLRMVDLNGHPIVGATVKPAPEVHFQGPRGTVQAIAPRADNEAVAVAVEGDGLRIWWARTGRSWVLNDAPPDVRRLQWSVRGDCLGAMRGNNAVRVWRLGTSAPVTPQEAACDLADDPASSRWVAGNRTGDGLTLSANARRIQATSDGVIRVVADAPTYREIEASGYHPATIATPQTNDTLITLFPKPNAAQRLLRYWWIITFGLGLAVLALTASVLLWRQRRRKLVLERRSAPPDQSITAVQLPPPQRDVYQGAGFGKLRTTLRRRVAHAGSQLDPDATVQATLDAAGWFTPVYRQHRRVPVYLALVGRAGARDQNAQRVQALLDRLRAGGVYVVEYTYRNDLRRCHPERGGMVKDLAELAGQYADHRLLIFGESTDLCDPMTGRPVPWITQLDAWSERALMTAAEPSDWGAPEVALLAAGLSILPATQAGLAGFVALKAPTERQSGGGAWPRSFIDAPEGWLTRHAPEPETIERLCDELRAFLDPEGYRWLQALAAHPELRWQLTLFLGLRLDASGAPIFEEQRLIRLTRLPWLRAGWMPDWLRLRLLSDMTDADEATVRAFLQDLLSLQSDAHAGFTLELARPDADTPRRWRRLLADLLRSEPMGSPLHDRLFVDFLMGKSPTALQIAAPTGWRRFVWSHGLKALGLRPLTAVVGCVVLLGGVAALGWGLRALDQQYDLPPGYAVGPVYSVDRTPDRVLQNRAETGVTAAGYCAAGDGSPQIVAGTGAQEDCAARLTSDPLNAAVVGALADNPIVQAATFVRIDPKARRLATVQGSSVYVWRFSDGAPTIVEHPEALVGVDLSSDGTRLLTASATRVIEWRLEAHDNPKPPTVDPKPPTVDPKPPTVDPKPPPPVDVESQFTAPGLGLTVKKPRTILFDGPMASTRLCLEACLKRTNCIAATYDTRDCKLFSKHAGTQRSINRGKMLYLRLRESEEAPLPNNGRTTVDGVYCNPSTNVCYARVYARVATRGRLTWQAARTAAEGQFYLGRRGHLVAINNAAEQAFLAARRNVRRLWIGAFQDRMADDYAEPKGGWRWVTNEPFNYTNWSAGEPNDAGQKEHWGELYPDGGWNDNPNDHLVAGYIVEFPPAGSIEPRLEPNTDRFGADLIDFDLPAPDPMACHARCVRDARCMSFTYADPNAAWGGNRPHCWLKGGVPKASPKRGHVSGIVR